MRELTLLPYYLLNYFFIFRRTQDVYFILWQHYHYSTLPLFNQQFNFVQLCPLLASYTWNCEPSWVTQQTEQAYRILCRPAKLSDQKQPYRMVNHKFLNGKSWWVVTSQAYIFLYKSLPYVNTVYCSQASRITLKCQSNFLF